MNKDELLRLALALEKRPDAIEEAKLRLRKAGKAPLTKVIHSLLADWTNYEGAAVLEKIASLNQGKVEDLNRSDFQSYIIAETGISEVELVKSRRTIQSFLQGVNQLGRLRVAARGDSLPGDIDMADIEGQLKKRTH